MLVPADLPELLDGDELGLRRADQGVRLNHATLARQSLRRRTAGLALGLKCVGIANGK